MSDIQIIGKMVTTYKGFTIVLNPFSQPVSWLVYLGADFIAKVTWLPDAMAIADARTRDNNEKVITEAL